MEDINSQLFVILKELVISRVHRRTKIAHTLHLDEIVILSAKGSSTTTSRLIINHTFLSSELVEETQQDIQTKRLA